MRKDRAWIFISKGEFCIRTHVFRVNLTLWIWVNDFWERWGKILGLKYPDRWAIQLNYEMKEKSMEVYCKTKIKWKNEKSLKFVKYPTGIEISLFSKKVFSSWMIIKCYCSVQALQHQDKYITFEINILYLQLINI